MNFVNRDKELDFLLKSIEEKHQIVYFICEPASGISAFLRKCLNVLADKYVFLLDAAEQSDFATAFCSEACKNSSIRNIMQNFADLKFGEKSQNFISSLLKSSPYGGEILSHITEKPSASHIYIGAFPSIYEEIIFPTINEMRKTKQVIFIIDNALYLSESSRNLCCKLTNNFNVYFIFALENKYLETKKFENGLKNFIDPLIVKPVKYTFCHPDTKMIQLLSESYQISCSPEQAEEIANISHDNIHSIINYLLSYNENKNAKFNLTQKIIINILNEVNYRISIHLLFSIVKYFDNVVLLNEELIEDDIERLVDLRIIEKNGDLVHLISKKHPKVNEVLNDWLFTDSVKSAILETFYEAKAYELNDCYLNESYRIALYFHDNRYLEFSKVLLKNAVATGISIGEDILTICKNNILNEEDSLVLVLYLTQCRRYTEALDIINKGNITKGIKPLYAVLLNRCRQHEKAEKELETAIKDEENADNIMILYAYLISNCVHNNDTQKAKQLFNSISKPLRKSVEFAYVLRNIATVCIPHMAVQFSKEAAKLFNRNHDLFGEFTAKCNQYRFLCEQGEHQKALDKMMFILSDASSYRNSDMHILLNNIAVCHIYLKNIDETKYYIKSALYFSKSDMPDIFIKINYSLLLLMDGNASKALEVIESIKNLALEYPVDRVRQRFFINYCHILYANNKNYDEVLGKAKIFKDRIKPNMTDDLCKFYEDAKSNNRMYLKEDFFKLFIPCYLEYWYTEPLKLVSSSIVNNILSPHTGSNNITNQILI